LLLLLLLLLYASAVAAYEKYTHSMPNTRRRR